MLSPQDLIAIREIAAMTVLFTSEDFRKATEAHAEKFKLAEATHKATLQRFTAQQQHQLEIQRAAIKEEEAALKVKQQEHKEVVEKFEKEKIVFRDYCLEQRTDFAQREQTLTTKASVLASQDRDMLQRQKEILEKESNIRLTAERLSSERLVLQDKFNKFKDLAA